MYKIAIDIGHGTDTLGKRYINGNDILIEHEFNSEVAKLVVEKFKLYSKKFEIMLVQKPNSPNVDLNYRIRQYNNRNVNMVYSIHGNANSNNNVNGACCFYWITSTSGRTLANIHVDNLKKYGIKTHGDGIHISKSDSWTNMAICRSTKAVGFLTENGFFTNSNDRHKMQTVEYRDKIASVIVDDILEYYNVEKKIIINNDSKLIIENESLKKENKRLQNILKEINLLLKI